MSFSLNFHVHVVLVADPPQTRAVRRSWNLRCQLGSRHARVHPRSFHCHVSPKCLSSPTTLRHMSYSPALFLREIEFCVGCRYVIPMTVTTFLHINVSRELKIQLAAVLTNPPITMRSNG